ncbi:ADP-ribosylglycohydrolase family protein [Streptomyces sp. MBT58]|uniref:ADP-ribosylglycohydrolase family protein n=1 Tax=Streptomyces sp. MBT58 TaxID=1488389 RepID=UPI0035AC2027
MTTNPPPATAAGLAAARRSLEALALGDAFGERWFPLFRDRRRAVVRRAAETPFTTEPWRAADLLGNGQRIRADDTVPFALWTAARHGDDLEGALWATAEGFGDVDTTCAITGGVVGAVTGTAGAPEEWLRRREPLG